MLAASEVKMAAAVVIVTAAAIAGSASSVGAHADYVGSCPGIDEVMSEVDRIEIGLDDSLIDAPERPLSIVLTNIETGVEIPVDPPQLPRPTVLLTPVDGLGDGSYRVDYEVVSADGDLNVGGFSFTVDPTASDATDCLGAVIDKPESGGSGSILVILAPLTVVAAGLFGLSVFARKRASRHST